MWDARSDSDMMTSATVRLVPSACVKSPAPRSGKESGASPGSTAESIFTPYSSIWQNAVRQAPAAITTIAMGKRGISFLEISRIASAPAPSPSDSQFIFCAALTISLISSNTSPVPAPDPKSFGTCISTIVKQIPLTKPPITGVEMNSTILPALINAKISSQHAVNSVTSGTNASASGVPAAIPMDESIPPTMAAGAASTPKMNCGEVENSANTRIGSTEAYSP